MRTVFFRKEPRIATRSLAFILLTVVYTALESSVAAGSIPPGVLDALKRTGTHRPGIERLLKNYEKEPEKLQAAYFLLAHARQHYTEIKIEGIDNNVDTLGEAVMATYARETGNYQDSVRKKKSTQKALKAKEDSMRKIAGAMPWTKPRISFQKQCDIEMLDSTILSTQIERAFLLREKSPLARRLSFPDFLEYILPYRSLRSYPVISPPSFYAHWFAQALQATTTNEASLVVDRYNDRVRHGRNFLGKYPFNHRIGARELFFNGISDCVDQAFHCANALRACGVPAIVASNSANRFFLSNHYLVATFDKEGRPCTFNPESSLPTYRFPYDQSLNLFYHYFSVRTENPAHLAAKGEPVPPNLCDPCIEDHTDWSIPTFRITLPFNHDGEMNLAYLASFQPTVGLVAVTWGKIDQKQKTVVFEKVVPDNLYFPVICTSGNTLQGFSQPFLLTADSSRQNGYRIQTFEEHGDAEVETWLRRKFPVKREMLKKAQQTIGTRIIASNDYAFKKADTLYKITALPENDWQDIALPARKAYQHYRVLPPDEDPHVHISEIEYLVDQSHGYSNVVLPRALVPRNWQNNETSERWMRLMPETAEKMRRYKISDGDVTTSPETANHSIHLSQPQIVDRIRFCIKNAGNGITYGDTYQLYEWREGTWQRLMTRMAIKGQWRPMRLKVGALYWLHDITKGVEEMPFTINEEGEQIFPMQQFLYRIR